VATDVTLEQIRDMLELHELGVSHAQLAEAFGISEDAVDLLIHGSKRRPRGRPGVSDPEHYRPRPRVDCAGCHSGAGERATLVDFVAFRRIRAGPLG